jgi:hypothetical protein
VQHHHRCPASDLARRRHPRQRPEPPHLPPSLCEIFVQRRSDEQQLLDAIRVPRGERHRQDRAGAVRNDEAA